MGIPADHVAPTSEPASSGLRPAASSGLRVAGIAARSIFIVVFVVVMAHFSTPANIGRGWMVHASAGDILKLAIGWSACVWMLAQVFVVPKDAHGCKTWLYLGPVLAALLIACAIALW
jgi:hypothetical protein